MDIKIFADCADPAQFKQLLSDPRVAGFTTNPSLAREAGVRDYLEFARRALDAAAGRPVSVEVLSDDFGEMQEQASVLASLGRHLFVKIPVTDSRGRSSAPLIEALAEDGVSLNITAVFTIEQVAEVGRALRGAVGFPIVSVFAGRIADAGVDPLPHVLECHQVLRAACPTAQLLWASARQVFDVVLAECAGCEIITLPSGLIGKLSLRGKDLAEYSRETVAQFARDAAIAGFKLEL